MKRNWKYFGKTRRIDWNTGIKQVKRKGKWIRYRHRTRV